MHFIQAGMDLQLAFDSEQAVIRVAVYELPVTGFRGWWKEAGSFKKGEWEQCPYRARVTDSSVQEMISYFWHDLEAADV